MRPRTRELFDELLGVHGGVFRSAESRDLQQIEHRMAELVGDDIVTPYVNGKADCMPAALAMDGRRAVRRGFTLPLWDLPCFLSGFPLIESKAP
jgi:hypothetical protein